MRRVLKRYRLSVGADRLGVTHVRFGAALVHPDRVQRSKVIGVGQRLLTRFGR
jgi:hypothetical protein